MCAYITFNYDTKKLCGVIESDVTEEIREYFSVKSPKFGAAKYNKYIPDRKYVITPGGRFKMGLYWDIMRYFSNNYHGGIIKFTSEFKKELLIGYDGKTVIDRGLRDYQNEIVSKCLKHGTGTVVLATAGGKTFTMASLVESISPVKCLIVVPDPGLVEQTYNDFIKYGILANNISRWTGEHILDSGCGIIIANRSILQSDKSDIEWIKIVDLLIVDEVQTLKKDNGITDIVNKIKTRHKYGFTGTLPENNIDRWTIIGITGPVIYERKAYELREEKYVAKCKALILNVNYKDMYTIERSSNPTENYRREIEWLMRNDFRNKLVTKICKNTDKNTLILVDRLEHGNNLLHYISTTLSDRKVYFINGEVEVNDRESIKRMMETENNIICIAISKIFAVGISINNLHYIIFCSGGKSRVRVIQSIGRGLRLHQNKDALVIIDIADQTKYGIQHSEKRKLLYIEEKIPFTENNITEVVD